MEIEPKKAEEFKEQGNIFIKKNEYENAIASYSEAIKLDPTCSIYFSNRSKAYKDSGDLEKALKDAFQSIELDEKNIRGHYYTGILFAQKGVQKESKAELEKALVRLRKSLALCSSQEKRDLERSIEDAILRCLKCIWFIDYKSERESRKRAMEAIQGLINRDPRLKTKQDKEKKFQSIIEAFGDPNKEPVRSIPSFYICFLTKKLMRDPYIVSSGYSYEKDHLDAFIRDNGWKDPRTSEALEKDLLYQNINLKQAIETFVRENPWSFEFTEGETIKDVHFQEDVWLPLERLREGQA